jgi:hypothetical protein
MPKRHGGVSLETYFNMVANPSLLLFWAVLVYFITTDAVIGFAMAVTGASFGAFGLWGIYSVVKALVTWPGLLVGGKAMWMWMRISHRIS